jgi:hypothetical protein
MFNNTDFNTNGELFFFNLIKDNINIIFDIGCKNDSLYLNFNKEVHYFDPVESNIDLLSNNNTNINSKSFFNKFGLSDTNEDIYYYPHYDSFINRNKTLNYNNTDKIILKVKKIWQLHFREQNRT